ncbi:MAG: hypothetical protein ILP11_01220, partial [Alphaproteobacteria bacterium]|nr:hypothetical protein [Alphaproteobacteria bacterium]
EFRPFMVVKMPPVESEKRFQEIVQLYRKALVIGLLCVALWPGMFVFVFSRWPEFSTFQKIPVAFISSVVPPLIYFVLRKISPYYKTPKEYKGYELAERTTVLYECQIMYALACIFVAALFGIFLLNTIYQSFV